MGTSLSGLTPATTFDGLLKVGDNDPLTVNLKAISTGDGTDTILQLSNSALQVNGDLNVGSVHKIYQDNTNLNIVGNFGSTALKYFTNFGNNNTNQFGLNNFFRYQVGIGFTGVQSSAMLNIKGSGNNNTTTALLVQNSDGSELFSIKDDGLLTLKDNGGGDALTIENGANNSQIRYNDNLWLGSSHGTYSPTLKIDRTAGLSVETNSGSLLNLLYDTGNLGIGETTPTARLHIAAQGNTTNDDVLLLKNTVGNNILKVSGNSYMNLGGGSGEGRILLDNAAGNAGLITANTNGVYIIGGSNVSQLFLHKTDGSTTIGNAATSLGARLGIKGSGATSATTALLVQNSAGDTHLSVSDNGAFFAGEGYNKISGSGNVLNLDFIALNYRIGASNVIGRMTTDGLSLGNGATNPTARLQVKGSGNDATTTALLVQNSDGTDMLEVDDSGNVGIGDPNPLSATLHISSQSYFNNTTALRIQNSIGNNLFRVRGDGTTDIINNKYIFNPSGVSTGGAIFKGAGATSATTALLVQDSAGTDLLKVRDDGWIEGISTLNSTSVRVSGNLQIGSTNFKVDNTNTYFQSQYTNNVFGGTNTDGDASALVTMKSTTQGFLPPRMTDSERDAITTPAPGLMVYDTSNNQMNYWNGATWIAF